MATEKQIAANRANALKSTGPRTEEGKARSCLNGILKGDLDEALVIESESREAFLTLEAQYHADYCPEGPVQRYLVDTMVSSVWRIYRLWHAERAAINQELGRQLAPVGPCEDLEFPTRTSMALRSLAGHRRHFDCWNRTETRLERQFRSAHDKLVALKKEHEANLGQAYE